MVVSAWTKEPLLWNFHNIRIIRFWTSRPMPIQTCSLCSPYICLSSLSLKGLLVSSCGKVIFSQVSVSHSVHRRGGVSGPISFLGDGWVSLVPVPFSEGGYVQGVGTHPQDIGPGVVGTHHPLLILSGSHHTYGRHAGGTHPTGMFSCKRCVFFLL